MEATESYPWRFLISNYLGNYYSTFLGYVTSFHWRKRYRSVTRKQANMDEHSFFSSPSPNHTKPISYLFGSPRFSNRFLPNSPYVTETMMSPTSILDTKPLSAITNPFGYDQNLAKLPTTFPGNKQFSEKSDPKPIGLALIDSLFDEKPQDNNTSKPNNSRKVLFGSKLKIQIPPLPQSALSVSHSPKSPADFGIKTRNSNKCSSPFGSGNTAIQTKPNGFLSVSEMELSEDYTCVITHGPNPRTTHIYDNYIVESSSGGVVSSELKNGFCSLPKKPNFPSKNFLSFCYTCNKNLGEGDDIFMYRGEKAFCSRECRFQEMIFDRENNSDF